MNKLEKIKRGKIHFFFYSELPKGRKDLNNKEPLTALWLDTFLKDDIFVDVGANCGLYSIYSSKKVKKVYSFEPHVLNFSYILRHIDYNNCDNIIPLSIPLSDKEDINFFHYADLNVGTSNNQLVNKKTSNRNFELKYTTSLDNLYKHGKIDKFDHIKIDVDGIEFSIVKGMENILKEKFIKSILCEYNPPIKGGDGTKIKKYLEERGYYLWGHELTPKHLKNINNLKLLDTSHNLIFYRNDIKPKPLNDPLFINPSDEFND